MPSAFVIFMSYELGDRHRVLILDNFNGDKIQVRFCLVVSESLPSTRRSRGLLLVGVIMDNGNTFYRVGMLVGTGR